MYPFTNILKGNQNSNRFIYVFWKELEFLNDLFNTGTVFPICFLSFLVCFQLLVSFDGLLKRLSARVPHSCVSTGIQNVHLYCEIITSPAP